LARVTSVTSDLTEVRITTQVHHEGGIADATIQTIREGRNVTLTQVLNNVQQVGTNLELLDIVIVLSGGVGDTTGGILGLTASEVVATLSGGGNTVGFGFGEFVKEHAVAPAAIVVEQGQAADRLVEHVEVTGVQQQALGGNQGFPSNLEGAGLGRIARIPQDRCTP
jgi:hypothetical protein